VKRLLAALVALSAFATLGALGSYVALGQAVGLGQRPLAAVFVLVAALGALLVLAGVRSAGTSATSETEGSPDLDELVSEAELYASSSVPAAVQEALAGVGRPQGAPQLGFNAGIREHGPLATLARSIEALGSVAVDLAHSQAELRASFSEAFVNLGRRNQNLVERQLEYISELEQDEADPAVLDKLFKLDHLATRMRRNAESLLVIAGVGPVRQLDAPVLAMDLARAACAEVEEYKRVHLHHFDPALISGPASADVVHVLAELIENALSFSPPASTVDVYGKFLEHGYVVVIVDSGIGMAPEQLAAANQRLRGQVASSELAGRYLGQFVAGKLAARHGLTVSLQPGHSGGLVARVKIPSNLVEEAPADLPALPGADLPAPHSTGPAGSAPALSVEPVVDLADAPAPAPAPSAVVAHPSVAPRAALAGHPSVAPSVAAPAALAGNTAAASGGPLGAAAQPLPGSASSMRAFRAREAQKTEEALRRLTRRVPGATLARDDGALRRQTPVGDGLDAGSAAAALSQYLSAFNRDTEGSSH
jgi:signal transduction histidine kinase